MSILCFLLIFISTSIRLAVTMDTIEKENRLADIRDDNKEEIAELEAGGKLPDVETLKKLHLHKYNHSDIIWFASNENGEYPMLYVPGTSLFLIGLMTTCLYFFYYFQESQEELAGIIHDQNYERER